MICERLKAAKEAKNMSNQQLADLSGVPIGTINRIFSLGTDNPGIQSIFPLAAALEVSLDELIGIPPSAPVEQDALTAAYEKQLAEKDRRIADKDAALKYRAKWITFLCLALVIVISFLIAWLIIDIVNPAIGWIRR